MDSYHSKNKPRLLVSFSGGRTSGYMTKRIIDNWADDYAIVVVFANTGFENEATLEFVNNCDLWFGFNTVWIEAVVYPGVRKSNGFKRVTFESASRQGEPFEATVAKYGIPNAAFPQCTRDLKLYPIENYARAIGWAAGSYETAIGIRTDELRRVRDGGRRRICYPLVDTWPSDKVDVLTWWEEQPFDLQLLEHQGNCKTCWKKSFAKLVRLYKEDPRQFDFFSRLEATYGTVGPEFEKYDDSKPRVFLRGNQSVTRIAEMAQQTPMLMPLMSPDVDGGCSESCELYATE